MREPIDVSGTEYEARAKLERVLPQFMLLVAGGARAISRLEIFALQQMKNVGALQRGGLIGEAFFVDQQGEIDAGILPKHSRIISIAQADGGEARAVFLKLRLVFAQLRDMLTAENSAIMAQEHDHSGTLLPQCAEAQRISVGVRQRDVGQSVAEGPGHLIQSI